MSEQEQVRRESLEQIKSLGINPFPSETFVITHNSDQIKQKQTQLLESKEVISIAGRIMSRRIMGNASFFEIQDEVGRVQAYIRRDDLCSGDDKSLYNTFFKRLLDIGDFVGIHGYVFYTQTQELTIHTDTLLLLSKSLSPLAYRKNYGRRWVAKNIRCIY